MKIWAVLECGGLTPLLTDGKESSVFLYEIARLTKSGVKPPQSE